MTGTRARTEVEFDVRKMTITASVLLIAGCAAHGAVPLEETSGYAPETVRQMLSGKVYVHKGRMRDWIGGRYFRPGGGFDFCGRTKSFRGTWTVDADSRGRATYRLATRHKRGRLYVPHYDRESGELKFRRQDGSGGWITASRGWLQASWPKSMAERCPSLAVGVPVDERQTGTTLAELRRQTPDAPLKGLAVPLPGAGSPEKATRGPVAASGIERAAAPAPRAPSPEQQLSDELVAGGRAHALAFMGEAYADRRFVFIGDGHLVVLDRDGDLAAGEGFEGSWGWRKGRLELRVSGDRRVHGIGWQDLARELGVAPSAAGNRG